MVTSFTPEGKALINIQPSDTAALDYGIYRYDVELTDRNGAVTTYIGYQIYY